LSAEGKADVQLKKELKKALELRAAAEVMSELQSLEVDADADVAAR
jgi:hypothetical protein